jgi:hypothetical protein
MISNQHFLHIQLSHLCIGTFAKNIIVPKIHRAYVLNEEYYIFDGQLVVRIYNNNNIFNDFWVIRRIYQIVNELIFASSMMI